MMDLYRQAYDHYESGQYLEAETLFSRLLLEQPLEPLFWQGFAATQQMESKFNEALMSWALLAHLKPEDPEPHLQAGKCYTALRQNHDASKAFQLAFDLASRDETKKAEILQSMEALRHA
jgi:type III secretion system low calcium response chaperone LcrH/SycD